MGFFSSITDTIFPGVGSIIGDGFGGISDTLFGDQGEGAQQAQLAENAANRKFIEEQVKQARSDVFPLFQGAQEARTAGSQAALDVFGGSIPSQLGAFQAGNVGAQQALTGGLGAFQQAILGLPQQALPQPTQIPVDTSFIPTQLPRIAPTQQTLPAQAALTPTAGAQSQPGSELLLDPRIRRALSGAFKRFI